MSRVSWQLSRGGLLTVITAAVAVVSYVLIAWLFDSPTETVQITWICIGIVGAIVTGANLIDSWIDLKILHQTRRNGELRLLARAGIRQDLIRLSQMVIVIGIGFLSLTAAPTLTAAQRARLALPTWTPTSIIITSGIAMIVILVVVQAILDRRARLVFYAKQGVRRPDRRTKEPTV